MSPRPDASGIGAMQIICIARSPYHVRMCGHEEMTGGEIRISLPVTLSVRSGCKKRTRCTPLSPAQLEISGSSSLIPPRSHFTTTFRALTGSKHVGMVMCAGSSHKRAGKEHFTLPVLKLVCCLHQAVFRKT